MKRLVVISDLHAGSRFAPIPPNWKLKDSSLAPRKPANAWLFERYEECIDEFGKPDILVVNGDATDGAQHLNYGREVYETDPLGQAELAAHLVNLWRAKEVWFTYGSRYHVEVGNVLLERVTAQQAKAKLIGWVLRKTIEGVTCQFAHEINVSTSTWQYRTTPIARQLVQDLLNYNRENAAALIVRSHAHYFCYAGFSQQLGIITPGWQGQTPYMARKDPSSIPKVGMVSVDLPSLDWDYRTFNGPMLEPEVP